MQNFLIFEMLAQFFQNTLRPPQRGPCLTQDYYFMTSELVLLLWVQRALTLRRKLWAGQELEDLDSDCNFATNQLVALGQGESSLDLTLLVVKYDSKLDNLRLPFTLLLFYAFVHVSHVSCVQRPFMTQGHQEVLPV